MSDFMAMHWFRVLSRYEYAMRVDDDVCVTRLPGLSNLMGPRFVHAFALQTIESNDATVDMFVPWLREHIDTLGLPTISLLPSKEVYFSDFFVSNVSWWSMQSVQRFLHGVNESGGIYTHRWGGAWQPWPSQQ